MSFLNASIPPFYCFVRKHFLYDGRRHWKEFAKVCVFGISSIRTRAIGFHVMIENGAVFYRLPIHALCWKKDAPVQPLDHLELWDAFSYDVAVVQYEYLKGLRCQTILKDKKAYDAEYMFTLDWCNQQPNDFSWSEHPAEHKCAHILKMENGNFAAQPNNRIFPWAEPSFIMNAPNKPDYKVNTRVWRCESQKKWMTEDTDKFFYNVGEETKSETRDHRRGRNPGELGSPVDPHQGKAS